MHHSHASNPLEEFAAVVLNQLLVRELGHPGARHEAGVIADAFTDDLAPVLDWARHHGRALGLAVHSPGYRLLTPTALGIALVMDTCPADVPRIVIARCPDTDEPAHVSVGISGPVPRGK